MRKQNHTTKNSPVKSRGVRTLLISGMTREQQIAFIKRKDSFYSGASFAGHSDEQIRELALRLDSHHSGSKGSNKSG